MPNVKSSKTTWLMAAALLLTASANATLIANGTPSTNGGGLVMSSFLAAESFTISSAISLQAVEFADTEFSPAFNDTLSYYVFDNNGFFPGNLLAQGTNPLLKKTFLVNGGSTAISTVLYDFNLNSPVNLSPGTYWIGLNFSGAQQGVWDSTTTPNAQLSVSEPFGTNNWVLQADQVYVGICATPLVASAAPEPGSLLLGGLGIIAFALHRTSFGGRR